MYMQVKSKEAVVRAYSAAEVQAVERFRQNKFFKRNRKFPDEQIKRYLLQRMFMSKNFVPWYKIAQTSVVDDFSRGVVSTIIDEEESWQEPRKAHFQLLIQDLFTIGLTADQLRSAQPSKVTTDTIRLFQALAQREPEAKEDEGPAPSFERKKEQRRHAPKITPEMERQRDLEILVSLRIAGEILVSEEYDFLIPKLQRRFGLTREKSVFFYPHHKEDSRTDGTHSNAFLEAITRLIGEQTGIDPLVHVIEKATDARMHFFAQEF